MTFAIFAPGKSQSRKPEKAKTRKKDSEEKLKFVSSLLPLSGFGLFGISCFSVVRQSKLAKPRSAGYSQALPRRNPLRRAGGRGFSCGRGRDYAHAPPVSLGLAALWLAGAAIGWTAPPKKPPESPAAPAPVESRPADGKLRIIVFGAHPDDAEITPVGRRCSGRPWGTR